jgi:hypothetical protein
VLCVLSFAAMMILVILSLRWKWSSLCLWNSCLFFKRKTVAVLPVVCRVSLGGAARHALAGLESFKVLAFLKRGVRVGVPALVTCVF